jgi:hypothetical protein
MNVPLSVRLGRHDCYTKAQSYSTHSTVHCRGEILSISVAVNQIHEQSCIVIVESALSSFGENGERRLCTMQIKTFILRVSLLSFSSFRLCFASSPDSHDRAIIHYSFNHTQATKPFRYPLSNHSTDTLVSVSRPTTMPRGKEQTRAKISKRALKGVGRQR